MFAIGQSVDWGNLLEGTSVTLRGGKYPVADTFTYRTADPDIFVGGDVFTGPRFVIDAIAQGHEVAESLHRCVRPNAHMTIGRDRRYYAILDKDNVEYPSYDNTPRQQEEGARGTLTESQVKAETNRCLSCGASYVDPNKCIGCGICTTRCNFDAIHLVRDHPKCSTMRVAEKKVGGLLSYSLKRAFKIIMHSGSKEARLLKKKRKAYKKARRQIKKGK